MFRQHSEARNGRDSIKMRCSVAIANLLLPVITHKAEYRQRDFSALCFRIQKVLIIGPCVIDSKSIDKRDEHLLPAVRSNPSWN
jgi:hypothetical protein